VAELWPLFPDEFSLLVEPICFLRLVHSAEAILGYFWRLKLAMIAAREAKVPKMLPQLPLDPRFACQQGNHKAFAAVLWHD